MPITPLASLPEANDYMENVFDSSDWDIEQPGPKIKALREATLIINNLDFKGTKESETQENEFPRIINGQNVGIPFDVKKACIEIANTIVGGFESEKEIRELMVESRQIGGRDTGMNSQYFRKMDQEHLRHGIPSYRAWGYLRPWLKDSDVIHFERGS